MKLFCVVFLSLCIYGGINGHGRLINPPSRASMWRYGFNTPPDYNDNQGYCGGFSVQYTQNGGKCGICGDAYNAVVKEHETPGKYATGKIVKNYQSGDTIKVEVEITANHKGYFIFRLCANNNVQKDPTQDCFDQTRLTSPSGSDRFYIDYTTGIKQVYIALPKDLVCTQCILQWTYNAGNSWGVFPNGTGCVGCGPQENFRACSDISINDGDDDGAGDIPELKTSTIRSPTSSPTSQLPSTASSTTTTTDPTTHTTKPPLPSIASSTTTTTVPTTHTTKPRVTDQQCHGAGVYRGNTSIDRWCKLNCALGYCPSTHCSCDEEEDDAFAVCRSHGVHQSSDNDVWCRTNCQLGYCPESHCICV